MVLMSPFGNADGGNDVQSFSLSLGPLHRERFFPLDEGRTGDRDNGYIQLMRDNFDVHSKLQRCVEAAMLSGRPVHAFMPEESRRSYGDHPHTAQWWVICLPMRGCLAAQHSCLIIMHHSVAIDANLGLTLASRMRHQWWPETSAMRIHRPRITNACGDGSWPVAIMDPSGGIVHFRTECIYDLQGRFSHLDWPSLGPNVLAFIRCILCSMFPHHCFCIIDSLGQWVKLTECPRGPIVPAVGTGRVGRVFSRVGCERSLRRMAIMHAGATCTENIQLDPDVGSAQLRGLDARLPHQGRLGVSMLNLALHTDVRFGTVVLWRYTKRGTASSS